MNLNIDREKFLVTNDDQEIIFPRKEFEVLWLLSVDPGKVYSRTQIFDLVWGKKSPSLERTVDVHIRGIRKKLGKQTIRTIKGVGYKLTVKKIVVKKFNYE